MFSILNYCSELKGIIKCFCVSSGSFNEELLTEGNVVLHFNGQLVWSRQSHAVGPQRSRSTDSRWITLRFSIRNFILYKWSKIKTVQMSNNSNVHDMDLRTVPLPTISTLKRFFSILDFCSSFRVEAEGQVKILLKFVLKPTRLLTVVWFYLGPAAPCCRWCSPWRWPSDRRSAGPCSGWSSAEATSALCDSHTSRSPGAWSHKHMASALRFNTHSFVLVRQVIRHSVGLTLGLWCSL